MPNWLTYGPTNSTELFDGLSDEAQRLLIARYACRAVVVFLGALHDDRDRSIAVSRLLFLRSAFTLLGKAMKPALDWPENPLVEMAYEEEDEFAASIINPLRHWNTGASPEVRSMLKDHDMEAFGPNVFEPDGFEVDLTVVREAPLFVEGLPKFALHRIELANRLIAKGRAGPVFWKRLYERLQNGAFSEWELLADVLSMPEAVWEKGAEAVAAEIEKIEAKHDLLLKIEAFERDSMAQVNRLGIGGNIPPFEIDDPTIIREVTIIWNVVHDLKEEVENDAPSKAKIEKLVGLLSAGLTAVVQLCGRLTEHALKVGVTLAVTAEATKVFRPDLLEAVIEAAKRFLLSGAAG